MFQRLIVIALLAPLWACGQGTSAPEPVQAEIVAADTLAAQTLTPLQAQATPNGSGVESGWFWDVGGPPTGGTGWGSHGADADAGTGGVQVDVVVPETATALYIPVITGPTPANIAFRVSDVESGAVLATLSAPADVTAWRVWKLNVPASLHGKTVRIELTDTGTAWGEWGAMGSPYSG